MEIRSLCIDDMESLQELYCQFWNEQSNIEKMKRKFHELEDNKSYIFLCAEEAGQLLGAVMGIVCEELYGACRPFLSGRKYGGG